MGDVERLLAEQQHQATETLRSRLAELEQAPSWLADVRRERNASTAPRTVGKR
jgi:hypothetical protein